MSAQFAQQFVQGELGMPPIDTMQQQLVDITGRPIFLPDGYEPQLEQFGNVLYGPGAKKDAPHYMMPKIGNRQMEDIQRAKKFAMEQSIKTVLVKQTMTQQQQQQTNFTQSLQRQQALALMCRVYIGSVNYDVTEQNIRSAFTPFGPIKNLSMPFCPITSKHKGFAFVEFETPEAASLSVDQMNNVMMGTRNVKVGRPTNMPQASPIIMQLTEEATKYNRIYVSSIHQDLGETDLKSVFEAFGSVTSVFLAPDPTRSGKHRGFGFIEYAAKQSADDAVASMNMFDLGGQHLRVGKAVTPPSAIINAPKELTMPTAAAVAAATITAKIQAQEAISVVEEAAPKAADGIMKPGVVIPVLSSSPAVVIPVLSKRPGYDSPSVSSAPQVVIPTLSTPTPTSTASDKSTSEKLKKLDQNIDSLENEEGNVNVRGREGRHLLMQKLMRQQERRVMVLRNMVGPEDVDADLENEITEECSKYGPVDRVIIYQEKQGEAEDAPVRVKIFVAFALQTQAEAGCASLNGRYFGGRVVKAELYEQEMFDGNDLSG